MSPVQSENATFDALYRTAAPAVRGYLAARGVDDPEAVTHDVFLAILPRLSAVEGGELGARSLLFSIAHARAVDSFRRQARSPHVIPFAANEDERRATSAEDVVLASAAFSPVIARLAELGDDQREVLLLRVVADLPLESVAEIMGRSVGSIKQLQRRALLALRRQLATDGRRTA